MRLVDVPVAQVEEARAFYRSRTAGRGPASYAELLEVRARRSAPRPADPPATEEVIGVPVRILMPAGKPRGVHLDIHAGGFYMDSAAHDDVRNRELADRLGIAVVSVDYRLAPEHPWPAAPDDCETVARWLVAESEARFGTSRLTIGGGSAGANLALATLLRLRERPDEPARFTAAALHFGAYDLSVHDEYFVHAYAGHVPDLTVPDISPAFGDLRGLPPILLVVGAADVLLPDNLALAARLAAAGNDVEIRVYPEGTHGFTGHPTTLARTATTDAHAWLDARIAQR